MATSIATLTHLGFLTGVTALFHHCLLLETPWVSSVCALQDWALCLGWCGLEQVGCDRGMMLCWECQGVWKVKVSEKGCCFLNSDIPAVCFQFAAVFFISVWFRKNENM